MPYANFILDLYKEKVYTYTCKNFMFLKERFIIDDFGEVHNIIYAFSKVY